MNNAELRTYRNADSDRLTAMLIRAFTEETDADVAVLVRQACEEFDTRTVLLGMTTIAAAFVEMAGARHPGGLAAVLASIDQHMNLHPQGDLHP